MSDATFELDGIDVPFTEGQSILDAALVAGHSVTVVLGADARDIGPALRQSAVAVVLMHRRGDPRTARKSNFRRARGDKRRARKAGGCGGRRKLGTGTGRGTGR